MPTASGERRPARLHFGGFTVDLQRRGLFREGKRVHLTSRPLEVLIFLAENPGRTVDKRELFDTVWKGLFVTDDTLVHAVAEIRRALEDDRDDPRFILTVPRHGYRMVAEVRREEPEPAPAAPAAEPPPGRGGRSGWLAALAALAGILAVVTLAAYRFGSAPRAARRGSVPFERVELTRLTSGGDALDAVISRDGGSVFYVTSRQGLQGLWMRRVGAADESLIAAPGRGLYQGLAISPDGGDLYPTIWGGEGPAMLHRLPVGGGEPTPLIVDVDSAVGLSPDGGRLAFIRGYPWRRSALMVARVDGSGETPLAILESPDFFPSLASAAPAWSPSGDIIATAAGRTDVGGSSMTLLEVRVEDGATRPITARRWAEVGGAVWLDDASLLVTARADASSPSRVWRVSYLGGEVAEVTSDLSDYAGLSAADDVRTLVALNSRSSHNIWLLPPAGGGQARQLTSSNLDGAAGLSWTPDGRIVYSSRAAGTEDLWIVSRDGTSRPLTSDQANDTWPAVSPGGSFVAFVSDRSGRRNIWRVGTDGGRPRQLTSGPCEDGPAPSADGRWVVYRDCAASGTLWRIAAEGGEPVQLTARAAGPPAVSPDGRRIAAADWNEHGIWTAIYAFSGGEPIRILDFWCLFPRWTSDGRALACIQWRGGTANIIARSLEDDSVVSVTHYESGRIGRFAWSRDGLLALVRTETQSDVVLLTDRSAD